MTETTQTHEFMVNGESFETNDDTLTATTILEDAKQRGAIARDPGNYVLKDGDQTYSGDDRVNVAEHPSLITAPTGRPLAS